MFMNNSRKVPPCLLTRGIVQKVLKRTLKYDIIVIKIKEEEFL